MAHYDSFEALSSQSRQDLADWLLAVADNKRLLGLRYAEWCTGAPELEADVAISAMAQYELGHARLMRGVLADLPEDPQAAARNTDPGKWRSLPILDRPAPGWPELVVLNGMVDGLLTVNLETAVGGGVHPLSQRLRKAVSEEHYHTLHALAWFERLLDGPDEIVERLRTSARTVLPQCLAWFGPEGDNSLDRLAAAGVIDAGSAALRERFLDALEPMLREELELPVRRQGDTWRLLEPIDWSGWHETTRRHGAADYDPESFAVLTGAYARAMGVEDS